MATLLSGCALMHPHRALKQAIGKPAALVLQVHLAAKANDDSVVDFDVVTISDKKLLDTITAMDASTWFKAHCHYHGDARAQVQFHTWELVPGDTDHLDVAIPPGVLGVLGFAAYNTPGDHRVTLATHGNQSIDMSDTGVPATGTVAILDASLHAIPEKNDVCSDQ